MLKDSGMRNELWAEAAATAARIRNLSPVPTRDKTPWELFYIKKPDVSDMRIFGAKAYALVPKELQRKLDGHSEIGRFVGYEAHKKACRIYLPSGNVRICADVINEEGSSEAKNSPTRLLSEVPASPGTSVTDDEHADPEEPDPDPSNSEEPEPDQPEPAEPRYPARERSPPSEWWTAPSTTAASAIVMESATYHEAINSSQSSEWKQAMDEEIKSLYANRTWTLESTLTSVKAFSVKWVYKVKRDSNGDIELYKARLVAKGFRQFEGIDFDEVFAPVNKYATLRALLVTVAVNDMELHQLDIKTAFLNGVLEEEVYKEQPAGYEEGGPGMACHLHRALFGLRQAPRAWHIHLMEVLTPWDSHHLQQILACSLQMENQARSSSSCTLMTCSSQHTSWQTLTRSKQASMRSSEHMILARHASTWAWPWTGTAVAGRSSSVRSGSLHSSWTHTTWQTARVGPSLSAWQLSSPRLKESYWTRLHTATSICWEVCFTCQSAPGLTLHKPWKFSPSTWQLPQQCTGRQPKESCGI